VSDSNDPPDDFSATTPNIKVPKKDSPDFGNAPSSDWEKTNYNYSSKELGKDEWNKTAFNAPKSPQAIPPDFDKTNYGAQPPAKDGEWGMTQANINLPGNRSNQYDNPMYDDYGSKDSDYSSKDADYGKTSVGIKLPRNDEPRNEAPKYEEPKYQDPHKKETVEETKEEKQQGGSRGWLLGLLGMFFFAVVVLLGVYFLFLGKTGFEVVVKSVPVRSDVLVDGSYWGVSDSDGTVVLKPLRAGQTKKIEIKNPGFKCNVKEISLEEAKNGTSVARTAECEATGNTGKTGNTGNTGSENAPKECLEIKKGDFETSRRCAYTKLDELEKDEKAGKMYTVDQLLFAMNLYIVNFDINKYNLKPIDLRFIDRASGFIKKLPAGTKIEVGGHTDSDGTDAKNDLLSNNRANAVKDALIQYGVKPEMLEAKGYGSKRPRPGNTNANEDEKFRNRRIEYTVLSK
jgi:outer membrane protein OmpA-like peptidoglycan-associated protein